MLKKSERGTLWDFLISNDAKHQKMEGGSFGDFFFEKNLTNPRNLKGGPFSLSRYCMLRGERSKTFLVQFDRPNGSTWDRKVL